MLVFHVRNTMLKWVYIKPPNASIIYYIADEEDYFMGEWEILRVELAGVLVT